MIRDTGRGAFVIDTEHPEVGRDIQRAVSGIRPEPVHMTKRRFALVGRGDV